MTKFRRHWQEAPTVDGTQRIDEKTSMLARPSTRVTAAVVLAFALIQLVPIDVRNHPVVAEPRWDAPRTRELAVSACYDCHSNETKGEWYEGIAPISWWITNHVDEGRAALNFSECGARRGESDEIGESVSEGSMPPSYYTWFGLHGGAKLDASERRALADGLTATAARGCQPAR